jgi:outer membrane lipoprotein-sorting protein
LLSTIACLRVSHLTNFLISISILSILSSCGTTAARQDITELSKEGSWSAKTLVQEKKSHKSHQLDLDFVAKRPRKVRMEATTPGLGIHVATFVLNGGQMSYLLPREKKYVTGPATDSAMRNLLHVPISGDDLIDLLFDRPLDGDRWNCKRNVDEALEKCELKAGEVSINWSDRKVDRRVIEINSNDARVTMSLSENPSKVQLQDSVFELSAPDGFKTQQL